MNPGKYAVEIGGFTMVPDILVRQYSFFTAGLYGKIWRYESMKDGCCRAATSTLADELGVSRDTIIEHLKILVRDGYIIDRTPDLRNRPHILNTTGKLRLSLNLVSEIPTVEVSENSTPLSEIPTVVSEIPAAGVGIPDMSQTLLRDSFKMRIEERQSIIPGSSYTPMQIWNTALGQLQIEMPKATYDTWLRDTLGMDFLSEGNRFIVLAPSVYAREWLDGRLKSTAVRLLTGLLNRHISLEFQTIEIQENPN